MTRQEFRNLKVGDTVYKVACYFGQAVVEERKVVCISYGVVYLEGGRLVGQDAQPNYCFLTPSEAYAKLAAVVNSPANNARRNLTLCRRYGRRTVKGFTTALAVKEVCNE